jgi:membrane-associated phospholipid phosphatase
MAFVVAGALTIMKLIELSTTPVCSFTLPFDQAIPFLPATLPIYLAFFPYILVAGWCADTDEYRNLLSAILLSFFVAAGLFLLLPAAMSRPDPSLITNSLLRQRFIHMYSVDSGQCTFPSLHIAATIVAMRVFARRSRLALGLGVLICISTLTVKQHVLLDVAGGAVLAFSAHAVIRRARRSRIIFSTKELS